MKEIKAMKLKHYEWKYGENCEEVKSMRYFERTTKSVVFVS